MAKPGTMSARAAMSGTERASSVEETFCHHGLANSRL
jgi:hypothetical protein